MKTAIVTGASGGIGGAVSRRLISDGYRVIMIYNATQPEMTDGGIPYRCDVTDFDALGKMYADAAAEYGSIDAVVNCHGIAQTQQIQDAGKGDIDRMIMTDLSSVVYSCHFASEYMIRQHSGVIVNVSSIWGVAGASCESVYSRAKGGVISFTKALAKELALSGIRVNCVSPGVIKTRMLDCYSAEDLQTLADETPLERLGKPDDIAGAVSFLVSENASFITGQNITVDGGFIL